VSTLARCMDEMANVIRDVVESNSLGFPVQVEPRMVTNPTPPCVDLLVGDPSENDEMGGFGELDAGEMIVVRVRVNTSDSDAGQDLLLAFMDDADPLSIKAALLTDETLNGTANSVDVESRSGYTMFPSAQQDGFHLGCTFRVMVSKRSHVTAGFDEGIYDGGVYDG
jgi:hypothetical protein